MVACTVGFLVCRKGETEDQERQRLLAKQERRKAMKNKVKDKLRRGSKALGRRMSKAFGPGASRAPNGSAAGPRAPSVVQLTPEQIRAAEENRRKLAGLV